MPVPEEPSHFIQAAREYAARQENPAQSYTAQEYFEIALEKGCEAREDGNYGIAALYIVSVENAQYIFIGKNNIISENNPHGHAEMNAIQNARELFNAPDVDTAIQLINEKIEAGILIVRERENPDQEPEEILYTTLEPCPMCTVGSVINAGIPKVIIGTPDEDAGQLAKDRRSGLTILWQNMFEDQKIEVLFCQSDNPDEKETYVDKQLLTLLNDLFFQTKEPLDKILKQQGGLLKRNYEILAVAFLALMSENE